MIDYHTEGKHLIVSLAGELDHCMAGAIRDSIDRLIDQYAPERLIFDMRGISFMDSSGIGMLIGRYKRVKRIGGRVRVTGLNKATGRVFEMAGLTQIMERVGDGRDCE